MSSFLLMGVSLTSVLKLPRAYEFSLRNSDVQFLQLFWVNLRWRIGHHIAASLILGERDHFTDIGFVREQHDQTVDAGRHTPMWRRAILKRLEHVTKLLLDLVTAQAQQLKDLQLDVTAMDADRARCHLISIADHVVRVGQNITRVGFVLWQIFYLWHCKRVMF